MNEGGRKGKEGRKGKGKGERKTLCVVHASMDWTDKEDWTYKESGKIYIEARRREERKEEREEGEKRCAITLVST